MFAAICRVAVVPVLAALSLAGGFAADETSEPRTGSQAVENVAAGSDADAAQARERLADLLASESIDRIDFQAETYDQAMRHIYLTVDTILESGENDIPDTKLLVEHASRVIEALDATSPRGMLTTFGKNVKGLPIRNPTDARTLGKVVGETVSLIHEQLGDSDVSYRDKAKGLFRSVILDPEEGEMLPQYLDGVRRVAELPASQRSRYFR